ncbi:unnamed protein product [Clonostachys rosea f. rosea IK726]|uniref:Uncharacterized protein n=1 Tax=Clonostachys rosea f. rosea IK726 TaxID=1349383 RepID=A0ACA9TZB2_BIOOC|nr:unnamed protein product [Clonostachys rosea f. rosea IK726]
MRRGGRSRRGFFGPAVLSIAFIALVGATLNDGLKNLSPNYTRTIGTPGYDVSETFPGSELDWELSLNFWSDVPGQVRGRDDLYLAATQLVWDPPSSIPRESDGSVKADSHFYYCLSPLKYRDPKAKAGEALDARCKGAISDSCLEDLQEIIDDESWCATSSWPSSCMEHSLDKAELHMYGRVNLTNTPNSLVTFPYNPDGHGKGDTTEFEEAMNVAWIVMTGFAEATTDGRLATNSNVRLKSGISCIRGSSPTKVTSIGSRVVEVLPTLTSLVVGFLAITVWLSSTWPCL